MRQKPGTGENDWYTARAVEGAYQEVEGRDRDSGQMVMKPLVKVRLEITEGECEGWSSRWTGWLHTPEMEPKTLQRLNLMGWDGNLQRMGFDPQATVRIKFKQDGEYLEIEAVGANKGGGGGPKPIECNVSADRVAAMQDRMRALMAQVRADAQEDPSSFNFGANAQQGQRGQQEQRPLPGAQHPGGIPQGRGYGHPNAPGGEAPPPPTGRYGR